MALNRELYNHKSNRYKTSSNICCQLQLRQSDLVAPYHLKLILVNLMTTQWQVWLMKNEISQTLKSSLLPILL